MNIEQLLKIAGQYGLKGPAALIWAKEEADKQREERRKIREETRKTQEAEVKAQETAVKAQNETTKLELERTRIESGQIARETENVPPSFLKRPTAPFPQYSGDYKESYNAFIYQFETTLSNFRYSENDKFLLLK